MARREGRRSVILWMVVSESLMCSTHRKGLREQKVDQPGVGGNLHTLTRQWNQPGSNTEKDNILYSVRRHTPHGPVRRHLYTVYKETTRFS